MEPSSSDVARITSGEPWAAAEVAYYRGHYTFYALTQVFAERHGGPPI